MSSLSECRKYSRIVLGTPDVNLLEEFAPDDVATNPPLINQVAQLPSYRGLLKEMKHDRNLESVSVALGVNVLRKLPGRYFAQTDARCGNDEQAILASARKMCDYFRDYGVDLDRVVLKIPANRGGMKAMSQLEKQGIACCMTTIYTMEQTIASVGKGASLVAPYLGPISDWQKRHKIAGRDLGLELAYDMHAYLKAGGHTAEIVSCPEGVEQVLCLCGIDYLCMDPGTMGALSASNEPPKVASFREKWVLAQSANLNRSRIRRILTPT